MEIPKKIKDDIWEYCRLNDIPNIDEFIIKMVKQGFNVEKFGATPFNIEPEIKEVEKIVEVIKEVPVEKIVEKTIEVPVEKEVIKEIYITDDEAVKTLQEELDETKLKLKDTIESFDDERESNSKINNQNDEIIEGLTKKINNLKTRITELENDLEEERNKVIQTEENNDIYGEDRKGFLGSNIGDIWKRKR